MNNKVRTILDLLDEHYKYENKCYLNHENAWQLLIATILSAQCTDDRVNIVTKDLFMKYKSIDDFADADLLFLEQDIRSTGFYKNKARSIKESCTTLREQFDYKMPSSLDDLLKFRGVGRKTANVVRGHIFNIPSIVVDTHVKRVSNRLGLVNSKEPEKIELELMKILPKDHWIRYNTQIIAHGRKICKARKPSCDNCFFVCI